MLVYKLRKYIAEKNIPKIKYFLQQGADPNFVGGRINPPIFAAVRTLDIKIVKAMVEGGADVNLLNNKGENLIHTLYSDTNHHTLDSKREIFKYLIEKGLVLSNHANTVHSPLFNILNNDDNEIFNSIIDSGFDIKSATFNNYTLLMHISKKSYPRCVHEKLLDDVDYINQQDSTGKTAIMHNSYNYGFQFAELLLKKGASVTITDFENMSAYEYISRNDYYRTIQDMHLILKDRGENIPQEILDKALIKTYEYDNLKNFQSILEMGANPNAICPKTKMHIVEKIIIGKRYIERSQHKFLELLEGNKVNFNIIDEKGNNLIHRMFEKYNDIDAKMLDRLIKNNIDINLPNSLGKTPMHILVKKHNERAVNYVIGEYHVNPNLKDKKGISLMHESILHGNYENVKVLWSKKADIDAQTTEGISCLILSCMKNRVKITDFLIRKGAKIFAQDKNGLTAFDYAAKEDGTEYGNIIDLLYNKLEKRQNPKQLQ